MLRKCKISFYRFIATLRLVEIICLVYRIGFIYLSFISQSNRQNLHSSLLLTDYLSLTYSQICGWRALTPRKKENERKRRIKACGAPPGTIQCSWRVITRGGGCCRGPISRSGCPKAPQATLLNAPPMHSCHAPFLLGP